MILKVSNNSEWKLCNYLRDTFNIAKTLLVLCIDFGFTLYCTDMQ